MKSLIKYLDDNHFTYSIAKNNVITIGEDTYELSSPNCEGLYFNRGFNYIGTVINANNYVYKFGPYYFTLKKGEEKDIKLKLFKYIGKANYDYPTESFLGVHGVFDLLNGSGSYKDWVSKAKFLGVRTLGICEKNSLAGVLKFQLECQKQGVKCIIGETVSVINPRDDIRYNIKLYVQNERGWQNLLTINEIINTSGSQKIDEDELLSLIEGLIIVFDPKSLPFKYLPKVKDAYYQVDSIEYERNDRNEIYYKNLQDFILRSKLKPVSICDAYYLDKEYFFLKRLLNQVKGEGDDLSQNQYFKSKEEYIEELSQYFKEEDSDFAFDLIQEAITNENKIAEECNFNVEVGKRHLPRYQMTDEEKEKYGSNREMFLSLISDGLSQLDLSEEEVEKYLDRLSTEIDVIEYGDVVDYFLVLWDIMQFCKREGILTGIGRGSAGGSLVAYLMGITHINPFDYNLLFERFLSKDRVGRRVDKEFVQVEFDNGLGLEFDTDKILHVFRGKEELRIKAKDLQNGDRVVDVELDSYSRDKH